MVILKWKGCFLQCSRSAPMIHAIIIIIPVTMIITIYNYFKVTETLSASQAKTLFGDHPFSTIRCSYPSYDQSIHPLYTPEVQCLIENICWTGTEFTIFNPIQSLHPAIGHVNKSWLSIAFPDPLTGFGQGKTNFLNTRFSFTISKWNISLDIPILKHPTVLHDISGEHKNDPGELNYLSWFKIMLLLEQFYEEVPQHVEVTLWTNYTNKVKAEERLIRDYGSMIFGKADYFVKARKQCFKELLVGSESPIGFRWRHFNGYFLNNPTLRHIRSRIRRKVGRMHENILNIVFIEKTESFWWNWNMISFTETIDEIRTTYPKIPVFKFAPPRVSIQEQMRNYMRANVIISQEGGTSMMNFLAREDSSEIIVTNYQRNGICGDEEYSIRNTISYMNTYRYCFPENIKETGRKGLAFERKINNTRFMKLIDLAIRYQCRIPSKFKNCPKSFAHSIKI